MFERFTDPARRVIGLALEEARRLGHRRIGTEHLLLGLLREPASAATEVLEGLGVRSEGVRLGVEYVIGRGESTPSGEIPFTRGAKKALELSLREALEFGSGWVGTEHLLLGLLRERKGVAAQVLVGLGVDHDQASAQVLAMWPSGSHETAAQGWRVRTAVPGDPGELDERLARELDAQLDQVRQQITAAVDAEEFDTVTALHDRELQLLVRKAQRELAGVDVPGVLEDNQRLQGEVERLRGLLRRHGVDPDSGTAQPA